ncbi:MAG: cytochrome c-type biogenesis protein [Chloroflexi bacterium]|nr:MAG: cytochrome c-type biogenesis protein [Chloroflexota bacterium]
MAIAQIAAPAQPLVPPRRATFLHAVAFVGGFSVVFVVLGASLGVVGFALQDNIIWFQRVAGVTLIVLGLHLAELVTIPFLMRTYQFGADTPVATKVAPRGRLRKYSRSVFVGSAFSLGWTPCVGPILAGILTLAADGGSVAQGTLLLVFYAAGLGIPFLLAGAALGSSTSVLKKIGPHMSKISIGSGILIVFMGMLIFLDNVSVLNDYFGFANSADSTTEGNITGVFGFGVAFLGGVLSFVSPCVLPLVPIYLSHLAGVGAEEALLLQQEGGGPPAVDALS